MQPRTRGHPPFPFRPLALAVATLWGPLAAAASAELATQGFRDEHWEVKAHLEHVAARVGELPRQAPARQREAAERVVAFFEKHIRPHAEWEEQRLYPLVDRLARTGEGNRFTATMRHEHRVVGRWIDALRAELGKSSPDYVALARRADNLLGLLEAHFEEEEVVLLPLVDRVMTRAQFEGEVGLRGAGRH